MQKKILVVGCTPPPHHGQAIMIENLVSGDFQRIKLFLVRMSFSGNISDVGKFQWSKIFHMVQVVGNCIYFRFRFGIKTFYYSPGGSTRTPIIRDMIMLPLLRIFFRKTIFHFHSAGTWELVKALPRPLRAFARIAYQKPDLAIYLSSKNLDHRHLNISNIAIVPNGLADEALPFMPFNRQAEQFVSILFVGIIKESKGVMVLLEALASLRKRGCSFECRLMGDFDSEEFRNLVISFCKQHHLNDLVEFVGVKRDAEKWMFFRQADMLCFPSFYQSESFGNVLVEAMMFSLPVVATNWRGIPDIVDDQVTGRLVNIQDATALAEAIQYMIYNPEARRGMGVNGRSRFLRRFNRPVFLREMETLMNAVAST